MKHGCRGLFGSGSTSSPSVSFLCDEGTGLFVGSQKGTLRGAAGGTEILALNGVKIAIGQGGSAAQEENTIVLNATGSPLDTASSSGFYVAPIKTSTSGSFLLKYDSQTKEVLKGKPVLQVRSPASGPSAGPTQTITNGAPVSWTDLSIPNGAFTYDSGDFYCVTPGVYQFLISLASLTAGAVGFGNWQLGIGVNGVGVAGINAEIGAISQLTLTYALEEGDKKCGRSLAQHPQHVARSRRPKQLCPIKRKGKNEVMELDPKPEAPKKQMRTACQRLIDAYTNRNLLLVQKQQLGDPFKNREECLTYLQKCEDEYQANLARIATEQAKLQLLQDPEVQSAVEKLMPVLGDHEDTYWGRFSKQTLVQAAADLDNEVLSKDQKDFLIEVTFKQEFEF